MRGDRPRKLWKRLRRGVFAALTGQTRFSVTLAVYSLFAVLLLGYVSAQVYTELLSQEIVHLKHERLVAAEGLNRLTAIYITCSSREKVSKYCKNVLGMIESEAESLRRFAIDDRRDVLVPEALVEQHSPAPDPYRFSWRTGNSMP